MKRIFSLLIAAILLMPLPAMAEEEQTVNSQAVTAANVLRALGVVDYDEMQFSEEVTRAEFAKVICAVAGYGGGQSRQLFTDVTEDAQYAPYINMLAQMKVMSGFGDGTFLPNQAVSGAEAMTAVVRALGYVYESEQAGGYPQGYIHTAQNLRLLDKIRLDSQDALTKETMALLLFNALEADMVTLNFDNGSPQYVKEKGQNFLLNTFQARHLKGIVDGVDLTRLRGENDIQPFYFSIDGIEIGMGDINVHPCLGYQVDAYYRDRDDEYTLIYMEKTAKNIEYSIAFEDINSIGGGVVNAAAETKNKKYSYDKTAAILYNGVSTAMPFSMDMIGDENGSLLLLDNNGDGTADVVFVEAYTNYVVGDTNSGEYLVYDFLNPGRTIKLDTKVNDPYTVIYNQYGEEISFGGIQQQGVLSVYTSLDDAYQKFIRAYFINDKVAGTVQSIASQDNYAEVTVNDRPIRIAEDYYEANKDLFKLGQNIRISLDRRGCGVYVQGDKTPGTIKYGFLIKVINADENDDVHEYLLKVLTEDGNFERIPLAEKTKIDGATYVAHKTQEDGGDVKSHLHRASVKNFSGTENDLNCFLQVIRYKQNNDGDINMIDTVLYNADGEPGNYDRAKGDNAIYMVSVEDQKYKLNTKNFGGQVIMEENAKVFLYPSPNAPTGAENYDYTDEKYFDVVTPAYFRHDTNYSVRGYYDAQRKISAPVVAYQGDAGGGSINGEKKICIFISTEEGIDADDMPVMRINFMEGAEKKTVLCDPDYHKYEEIIQMKCGDVFRYSTDFLGYISQFERIYSIAENELLLYKGAAFANTTRFALGYVMAKYEDGVKYTITEESEAGKIEYFPNASFEYVMYDSSAAKDANRITTASIKDILGSEDVGISNSTRILIQYKWGDPQVIYIIK